MIKKYTGLEKKKEAGLEDEIARAGVIFQSQRKQQQNCKVLNSDISEPLNPCQ